MKKTFFSVFAISAMVFTACNNNSSKNETGGHDMQDMHKDSVQPARVSEDKEVKTIQVTYSNLDPSAASSIKAIIDDYLHIKNALANDNGGEAANAAKAMDAAITKLDKSLLTAEQKSSYDKLEDELKEHADHIGKSGDKIKHQRSHFVSMSEVVYELVKDFGAGRPVYHDHCPMARDNQGAMWISEIKEIRNPYLGAEMPTCGTVEELIQ